MGSLQSTVQTDIPSITVHPEQPWLCENGKRLSDEQIKTVSKSWDAITWEHYLCWFESPMAETLIPERSYDRKAEAMIETIFVRTQSHADDSLRNRVGKVLDGLTVKQRRIVEMTFWQGKSERQIADELNLSRSTIKVTKRRALSKLATLLRAAVIALPKGNSLRIACESDLFESEAV